MLGILRALVWRQEPVLLLVGCGHSGVIGGVVLIRHEGLLSLVVHDAHGHLVHVLTLVQTRGRVSLHAALRHRHVMVNSLQFMCGYVRLLTTQQHIFPG